MDNVDLVVLFNQAWPVLLTIAILAVVAPRVPGWGWKVLTVLPGAIIVVAGFILALATIYSGGDARVNGVFLLQLLIGGIWSAWWGCRYWENRKISS